MRVKISGGTIGIGRNAGVSMISTLDPTGSIILSPYSEGEASLSITEGLQGRWMGDAGVISTNGDMTTWEDQSINNNNWYHHPSYSEPKTGLKTQNGKNVISFQYENVMSSSTSFMNGEIAAESFVVVRASGSAIQARAWMQFGSPNEACHYPYSTNRIWDSFASNKRYDTGAPIIDLTGSFHIYNVRANNSGWNSFINGSLQSGSETNTVAWDPKYFIGGTAGIGGDLNWHGDMAEFLIYNRILSTAERSSVINYLQSKWNIVF